MKTFAKFLEAKGITEADFNAKDAEAQAGLYNEYNKEQNEAIAKAVEAKASKEDIESLKSDLEAARDAQFKSLNAKLVEMGVAMTKGMKVSEGSSEKGLLEMLEERRDDLVKLKNSSSANDNVKLELKVAGDMSLSGNVTGQVPQALRLPGLNEVASRQIRFLDVLQRGTISSNVVEWVYQANKDGSAGQTAEAAAKNQIDFDLLVGSQKVEKTTAYITVTDEMLDDVEFIQTAINDELTRELLKAVELGAYSGSGVSPQLNGVKTVASAFAAGAFAGSVDNANIVDVLTVAANQIALAEQGTPNAIFMNPSDVTALKMEKVSSTDKRYVERLAMVAGELSLDGIRIIPTTLVTQDEYLIGDFSKAFMLQKQAVSIEIGYNADNFVKNFKTIRAEWRGVIYVKNNDRTAFVTGDFTTDKAAIETP
jgi:HK97 family phage major capsid protein